MCMQYLNVKENWSGLYIICCITYYLTDVIDPSKASKSKGKKKGRSHQKGMAELRASLMGEQLTEMVTQPVKETMSAGKALIGLGQRFTGWLGSLVKAN